MYMEMFYIMSGFIIFLLSWLTFVNYKLNYPDRVGPKIGSSFDLGDCNVIGDLEIQKSEEQQLYFFVSPECVQCKDVLDKIQQNHLKYKNFVNIIALGELQEIEKWKTERRYDFSIICMSFEQISNTFNINIFPFVVKTKNAIVEEKSFTYHKYFSEDFETVGSSHD